MSLVDFAGLEYLSDLSDWDWFQIFESHFFGFCSQVPPVVVELEHVNWERLLLSYFLLSLFVRLLHQLLVELDFASFRTVVLSFLCWNLFLFLYVWLSLLVLRLLLSYLFLFLTLLVLLLLLLFLPGFIVFKLLLLVSFFFFLLFFLNLLSEACECFIQFFLRLFILRL